MLVVGSLHRHYHRIQYLHPSCKLCSHDLPTELLLLHNHFRRYSILHLQIPNLRHRNYILLHPLPPHHRDRLDQCRALRILQAVHHQDSK